MESEVKLLVRQFKALSNEHRLKLMLMVLSHEQKHGRACGCQVSELVSDWRICAPTISHHLRVLESAQLIDVEKSGKYVVVRLNPESYQMRLRLFRVRPIDELDELNTSDL